MNDFHIGLNILVYGKAKTGKTTFGATTPAPRLILDAEMGARFVPGKKVVWDPKQYAPPVADGTWDTAIVYVRDYQTIEKAYEWLNSGQHPFVSVVLDSISEIQQRCIDALVGHDQMKQQDWGTLLRRVSELVRQMRDLTTHPVKPLDAVVIIAMAKKDDEDWRPYVQGSLSTVLPYHVDCCAYLAIVPDMNGELAHRLYIGPTPGYITGERVGGALGSYVDNPNVVEMLRLLRGETKTDTKKTDTNAKKVQS